MPNSLSLAGRTMPLPRHKWARIALGSVLVLCGTLGFLPILGFWMIPLGLLVLGRDVPAVRRFHRRMTVKFGRWREKRRKRAAVADPPLRR